MYRDVFKYIKYPFSILMTYKLSGIIEPSKYAILTIGENRLHLSYNVTSKES